MAPKIKRLVVDTTAFIKNAALHNIGEEIITIQEVVDEIQNKRQLKRLAVLPYNLKLKSVFPEYISIITEFSIKTGDYRSLSATDIKLMALTYQLEKEANGTDHLNKEPKSKTVTYDNHTDKEALKIKGFYLPKQDQPNKDIEDKEVTDDLADTVQALSVNDSIESEGDSDGNSSETESEETEDSDEEIGWINSSNIEAVKKEIENERMEEKQVEVACLTTDFAMQNVLKQIGLNVASLDGKIIKEVRTFIFRCYSCFKTTSVMTKVFCPKCGYDTLKKVAVSIDKDGNQIVHINLKRPLSGRGKRFSLPKPKGGKHANYPILFEDQPRPDQKPSRLATTRNNPLEPDYIAGFSPFVMRDVNSKSAMLGIRPGQEIKYWMRRNPNEVRRKRK